MEWVTGVKLSLLPQAEVRALAKVGQEAFLTQLLEIGAPLCTRRPLLSRHVT